MRALIVENETPSASLIASGLKRNALCDLVEVLDDARIAVSYAEAEDFHLIVLGQQEYAPLPAIVLSLRTRLVEGYIVALPQKDIWQANVELFDAGCDYVFPAPWHLEVLLAHVRAAERRILARTSPITKVGPLTINARTKRVWVENNIIVLTSHEYRVLELLANNRGAIVSRDQLHYAIYASEHDRGNTIEVFIARVRRKISTHLKWDPIRTIRGMGYTLDSTESTKTTHY